MGKEVLVRSLGGRETTALVVGTVIGTGIFLKSAVMAQALGSAFWVLAAWVTAGILSYAGAICYAELGSRYPHAGGEYVYLREAYGDLTAFLYGWMHFWIGSPGSIAAFAVGAATFLAAVVPTDAGFNRSACAFCLVWIFTILNCFSARTGGRVQVLLTTLKLILIVGLIAVIFVLKAPTGLDSTTNALAWTSFPGWSAFGTAIIAALWAYGGWNYMPMAAGEVAKPERNIPLALGLGMLAVLVLYTAVNIAYFLALPFTDVVSSFSPKFPQADSIAGRAATTVFGTSAATFLSLGFVISALGAMNGSVLAGARIPFAMARDGLCFAFLGRIHRKSQVPIYSVLLQGVVAGAMALTGTFDQLTHYVVLSAWIFYALVASSLFIHRRRESGSTPPEGAFRLPWYPALPVAFLFCAFLLIGNAVKNSPTASLIGAIFIACGVPVYMLFKRQSSATDQINHN